MTARAPFVLFRVFACAKVHPSAADSAPFTTNWRTYQHRTANQRSHSRLRGPTRRARRRAGRNRTHRGRPAPGPGVRARPGGGGPDGPPAGRQAHGLRQVQVRERPEGAREPPQPDQHRDQGNEAPAEDRQPRLRDQEGSRRALPQGRGQGQDHDHVPWPRAVAARARLQPAEEAGGGRRRVRLRRVLAQAGRPQHVDGARPAQEEGRGASRGCGRAGSPDGRSGRPTQEAEHTEQAARRAAARCRAASSSGAAVRRTTSIPTST